MELRHCNKCGNEYPATSEYFVRGKAYKDGLRPLCKECKAQSNHNHYVDNRQELAQKNAERYAADPDRWKAYVHARRANEQREIVAQMREDVRGLYILQRGCCYYCKKQLGRDYHIDHIIPISAGGTNQRENIVITCAGCNLSKGTNNLSEWIGKTSGLRNGHDYLIGGWLYQFVNGVDPWFAPYQLPFGGNCLRVEMVTDASGESVATGRLYRVRQYKKVYSRFNLYRGDIQPFIFAQAL